jgi:hypothetical protein
MTGAHAVVSLDDVADLLTRASAALGAGDVDGARDAAVAAAAIVDRFAKTPTVHDEAALARARRAQAQAEGATATMRVELDARAQENARGARAHRGYRAAVGVG